MTTVWSFLSRRSRYSLLAVLVLIPTLAGLVWSRSGPSTYSLKISPTGSTVCSSADLLSPPFYKCSGMDLLDRSGSRVGTADWGYNSSREALTMTLELRGDIINYALSATQKVTGKAVFPSCSAQWTIETRPDDSPQVIIQLSEYSSRKVNSQGACRSTWQTGTITQ